MRPRGPHRAALTGFVSGGGTFTMRELAGRMGCTIGQANTIIRRAVGAGELRVAGTTRVPGAKRPVAKYQSATVCTDAPEKSLVAAIQGWGR